MRGGTIIVNGTAGLEVGMRMRRGIIVIGGQSRNAGGGCDTDKFSSGRKRKSQSFRALAFRDYAGRSLHLQHNPNSQIQDMPRIVPASKIERGLQFNFAVGGSAGRERPTLQRVGNIKQSRAHYRIRVRRIHIVEHVASVYAEGEVITPVGIRRGHRRSSSAEQRSTRSSSSSRPTTAPALSLVAGGRFCFWSEAKSFGEAQVQDEVRWTGLTVDRQESSLPSCVEGAQGCAVNIIQRTGDRNCGTSGI